MFSKYQIGKLDDDLFNIITNNIKLESLGKGRVGAILVSDLDIIPTVRTTANYKEPVQPFLPIIYKLIRKIKKNTNINANFNNAMIEIYDNNYKTMGYHSDQALDLDDNSYICLFSCYNHNINDVRKLQIKNKVTNNEIIITLDNNSIILFSLQDNKENVHKIILDNINSNNKWLGITLRLSKTYIKFINEIPYLSSDVPLYLANDKEKNDFYKCKGYENKLVNYIYPKINYTCSISDILKPLV